MWTLSYDTESRAIDLWGMKNVRRSLRNLAPDILSFDIIGNIDDELTFSVDSFVRLYKDGVQWFVGRVVKADRSVQTNSESVHYTVLGPWHELEAVTYQTIWQIYSGPVYSTHIFLGINTTGQLITTAESITKILTDSLTQIGFAAYSVGSILPGPTAYLPVMEEKDISPAEAFRKIARWHPDAVGWFDYSQAVPVFHFRQRADLAVVNLTLGDNIKAIDLKARTDLVVSAVAMVYEARVSTTVEGRTIERLNVTREVAPVGATGLERKALVLTVDLLGPRTTVVRGEIFSKAIAYNDIEWWKARFPALNDSRIDGLTMIKVERPNADTPTTFDDMLPYELLNGQVADWMTAPGGEPALHSEGQEELVATFSYTMYDDSSYPGYGKIKQVTDCKVTHKFTSTNLPSGLYQDVSVDDLGDPIPLGLAQNLYNSLSVVQYDGQITLHETEVMGTVGVGKAINIAGGRQEWEAFKAMVQTVDEDIDRGVTNITVGPPNHLSPETLIALMKMNRRVIRVNPTTHYTQTATNDGVELGKGTANATGLQDREIASFFAVKDALRRIALDASNPNNYLAQLLMESGGNKVDVRLSECLGKELRIREVEVCKNGVTWYMLGLFSEPYQQKLT